MAHKNASTIVRKPLKMTGVPPLTEEQRIADQASFEPYRKQLYGDASLSKKEMTRIAKKTLDGLYRHPQGSR